MAEQQLVDYIKKAKEANQSDDQTRAILYKSGWTETEVADAFMALGQPQVQVQPKSQPQAQPQAVIQPRVEEKPTQPQPQFQQQSNPAVAQSVMPRVKKSHTITKLFMVLIIVAVLGGAGYIAASQYLNLNLPYADFFSGFFAPKPEEVLTNMIANMKNVKSSRTLMIAEVGITDDYKSPLGKVSFRTEGESDTTNEANPKGSFSFNFDITSLGFAPVASVDVNMVVIEGASYIKVNDFVTGFSFEPGVSKIKGKWLKIDNDSITALSALSAEQGAQIGVPDLSQINGGELTKKIQGLFMAENLLSFDKQLADEIVEGQNTYHYMVKITKEKVGDLANRIISEIQQNIPTMQQNTSGTPLQGEDGALDISSPLVQNMIQAFVKTFVDATGDINIEMWIGKKDKMLYKFTVDKTIDLSSAFPEADLQANIKLNSTSSNFNQPISVQAPADAQKIEDAITPILKNTKIGEDMTQLEVGAGQIFSSNGNYSVLCRNGFVNAPKTASYSQVFIATVKDIMALGGSNPACFASLQDYCVSTQLADGGYLCIGKTGVLGTVKCESAKTVCE